MTKEELFERWKSEQYKDQSTEEKYEFVEHLHNFPQYFKKAYIAGAESHILQWHDLRKDTDDLPEAFKNVYVCFTNGDYGIYLLNDVENIWVGHRSWNYFESVIAWCELPKFEGVENGTENN